MGEKIVHDLAVAYAQAKLIQFQQEHPDKNGDNDEVRLLVKAYYHACYQIPIESEDLDEHFYISTSFLYNGNDWSNLHLLNTYRNAERR